MGKIKNRTKLSIKGMREENVSGIKILPYNVKDILRIVGEIGEKLVTPAIYDETTLFFVYGENWNWCNDEIYENDWKYFVKRLYDPTKQRTLFIEVIDMLIHLTFLNIDPEETPERLIRTRIKYQELLLRHALLKKRFGDKRISEVDFNTHFSLSNEQKESMDSTLKDYMPDFGGSTLRKDRHDVRKKINVATDLKAESFEEDQLKSEYIMPRGDFTFNGKLEIMMFRNFKEWFQERRFTEKIFSVTD